MKKIILMLCLIPLLIITSCDNDDDSGPDCQGIDCLPEATQTGAGTFGCLVNGEPFYAFGGVNAQYQLINGEYFFGIGFSRGCCFPRSIGIVGSEAQLSLNNELLLTDNSNGNFFAEIGFFFDDSLPGVIYGTTDETYSGTLIITKLDQLNQIVSGTFEFEILNPDDGQVYQITEGRFDSYYAQ